MKMMLYTVVLGLLLSLLVSPYLVVSQEFSCYASTDCHGAIVNTLPQRGDCCAVGNGLSFTPKGSSDCRNCFNIEDFVSEGSEFYLVFFDNDEAGIFSRTKIVVRVNNLAQVAQTVILSYKSEEQMMHIEPGDHVDFNLPTDIRLQKNDVLDKVVSIQSTEGTTLSVSALGDELSSSDTYQILPFVYLPTQYEYYAVSVAKVNQEVVENDEEIVIVPRGDSVVAIVASEDNTQVSITPTQNVNIESKDILTRMPQTLLLNQREALLLSSEDDLTGTHIVSDKPISVFSGHECGHMPANISFCDHMVEQLPPTATWGTEFYTASFMTRPQDVFKVISARGDNSIMWVCTDKDGVLFTSDEGVLPIAGAVIEITIPGNKSCRFESIFPVLLVQFSVGGEADNNVFADPLMTVIPPVGQYRNMYMLDYFSGLMIENFVNIILVNTFGVIPSETLLNGEEIENIWTDILCKDDSNIVCAFGTQVELNDNGSVTVSLSHRNVDARLVGIPYAMGYRMGRGSFSGMTQIPIAIDEVTLTEVEYIVVEGSNVVNITITRSGGLLDDVTVPFRTHAIPTAVNPAISGEDFDEREVDILFPAGTDSVVVQVSLGPGDIFPGPDRVFEVYLGSTPGAFVSPIAHSNVTIIDDDLPLPVMNVSFSDTVLQVNERDGCVDLMLVKSEGGVGPVTVMVIPLPDSAKSFSDFELDTMNVTFEASVTVQKVSVGITNDDIIEDYEMFQVMIVPVDGVYPVDVVNPLITIEIADDDVVIMALQAEFLSDQVSEAKRVVEVTLLVLSGGFNTDLMMNLTSEGITATEGNDFVIEDNIIFFSPSTSNMTLRAFIMEDSILEDKETFRLVLSSTQENVTVVSLPLTITIIDNECVDVSMTVSSTEVSESDGEVEVTVSVDAADLSGIIRLGLSTVPISGDVDFKILTNEELSLEGSGLHRQSIEINDNSEYSGGSSFAVMLALLETDFERLCPMPAAIVVNVTDDEPPPTEELDTLCIIGEEDRFLVPSRSDCCLLRGGSSFESANYSIPCIVIGFEQDFYELPESFEPHNLHLVVLQGSLTQNLSLTIISTPITAARSDYSLLSPWVRLIERGDGLGRGTVTVTLALELESDDMEREQFRLDVMEESGVVPRNVFFRGTEITILDISRISEI